MSTTLPPAPPSTTEANRDALIKHHAIRGYQYASVAVPPLFIIASLVRRRPLRANSIMASAWTGGAAGALGGLGAGFIQYKDVEPEKLAEARANIAYDARQVRMDDYATIGAILGALLGPAALWHRTRLVHSLLGGATIGVGGGTVTHYWKSYQEGQDLKMQLYEAAPKKVGTA